MVELEFQIDLLTAAVGAAKRYAGTPYQRFLFVVGHVRIAEKQYRVAARFTYAMYCRHLSARLADKRSATEVLAMLHVEHSQHPACNTGANSDELVNLPLFEEV